MNWKGLIAGRENRLLGKRALALLLVVGSIVAVLIPALSVRTASSVYVPVTRNITLTVQSVSVEISPGTSITMWGYNGTVPGPTIWANVGDTLHITLKNQHTLKHSLHVHGLSYDITSDGSQGDPGKSDLGIVAPGAQYTYTFKAERPGLYAYHCHSDDQHEVSVHIQQGLYGAIVIDDPNSNPLPPVGKKYVLMLGEAYGQISFSMAHGCAYCFGATKHFTINARQMPLTPTFTALPGEHVRFYVINVGNDIHSFHLHGHAMYRWKVLNGQWATFMVRNDNEGLVPMESAIIDVIAGSPGRWLYHCHIEPHADEGMMGIFEVQPGTPVSHNMAVTEVVASRYIAYSGVASSPTTVNVTVANRGLASEGFTVTAKANETIIGTRYVTVAAGTSEVVSFDWNPELLARGGYRLTAETSQVLGETNPTDNSLLGGLLTVRLKGDVNGDCIVDVRDLVLVGLAFTSTAGPPASTNWNPYADLNNDRAVNINDLVLVGSSFSQTCPT